MIEISSKEDVETFAFYAVKAESLCYKEMYRCKVTLPKESDHFDSDEEILEFKTKELHSLFWENYNVGHTSRINGTATG